VLIVEAATLIAQKKKQNAATAEWVNTHKKKENKIFLGNKPNSSKNISEVKQLLQKNQNKST
jgi:hypothetical protein